MIQAGSVTDEITRMESFINNKSLTLIRAIVRIITIIIPIIPMSKMVIIILSK